MHRVITPGFNNPDNIRWTVEIMEFSLWSFLHSPFYSKDFLNISDHATFFYSVSLLASCQTLKIEGHPLLAVYDCLFDIQLDNWVLLYFVFQSRNGFLRLVRIGLTRAINVWLNFHLSLQFCSFRCRKWMFVYFLLSRNSPRHDFLASEIGFTFKTV